jgi:outer membrane lipoprotein SlyB
LTGLFDVTQEEVMKLTHTVLTGVLAISALAPLALMPGSASAQQYSDARRGPRIEGFNVDEVTRIAPGVELHFSLYGTAGGSATMRIGGARRDLSLAEVEAGRYEGSYTVSNRDKIVARSPVTVNLRIGNQVVSAVLSESLQAGVGYHQVDAGSGARPSITRFDVIPTAELSGGEELTFTVSGTPRAKVDLVIPGVKGKIYLPEVSSGEYTNTYTIRRGDRIASNSMVTANLHFGERTTSVVLGRALQSATSAPVRRARLCNTCGTVEAVNPVEVKGDGSYLGAIGGGLVGAVLGSQVGGGNGRTAAQIAGVLGGAYAGNKIQANMHNTTHYEVVVRLQNGGSQTMSFETEPGYRVGDKVQIIDGVMARSS